VSETVSNVLASFVFGEMFDGPYYVRAEQLQYGDVIVERDARGKKHQYPVHGRERTGQYGHGHIVVSVGGKQMWRYEPEALVEVER
jgi:hypothetical protein